MVFSLLYLASGLCWARLFVAGAAWNPTGEWVTQQARNLGSTSPRAA
jgi:hypothetical protein